MIWLTGNNGMLGSAVESILKENKLDYIASDIEVDITKINEIDNFIIGKKIEWIINTAAYTNVDKAEKESQKVFLVNAQAVKNLAEISRKKSINLIHISTDYVFSGEKNDGYKEENLTNPQNMYGKSKLEGEKYIKEILENYFIIRTAWLYGKNGKNFVNTIVNLLKEKDEIKVIDDQRGSPTYTKDLAEVIIKIIKNNYTNYGIYNFTNEGTVTWYEFANEIYKICKEVNLIKKEVELIPVGTEDYPLLAKRPRYSVLSKEKIKMELDIKIRNWKDSLKEFLLDLKKCEN